MTRSLTAYMCLCYVHSRWLIQGPQMNLD